VSENGVALRLSFLSRLVCEKGDTRVERRTPSNHLRSHRSVAAFSDGLAGIAAGTVSGVMVLSERSVILKNCDARNECETDGLRAADRA
jgi:hypothetical protein